MSQDARALGVDDPRDVFEVDSPYFVDPRTNTRHFEATFAGISTVQVSSPSSVTSFSIFFHFVPTRRCSTTGMPSAAGWTVTVKLLTGPNRRRRQLQRRRDDHVH